MFNSNRYDRHDNKIKVQGDSKHAESYAHFMRLDNRRTNIVLGLEHYFFFVFVVFELGLS